MNLLLGKMEHFLIAAVHFYAVKSDKADGKFRMKGRKSRRDL